MNDEEKMRKAIQKAREGVDEGQSPFGACIYRGDDLIVCAHNGVWARQDITAHAEIIAIRRACSRLKTIDLSGCVIYTTCEPCTMCFGACHWARIDRIVYGTSISDSQSIGFGEVAIPDKTLRDLSNNPVQLVEGVLKDECQALFDYWVSLGKSRPY